MLFLSSAFGAQAATLYFSPAQGDFSIGDIFTVDVRLDLDSADDCINTVEGVVGFDNSYLAVEDFGIGDSFLSLWLNRPGSGEMDEVNHQKRLKFTGGTPGGYCGKIPGDDGDSNIVGKVVFRVINAGADSPTLNKTKIFFYPDTMVLLNDGFGTQAKLDLKEAEFQVNRIKGGERQEWDRLKTADNIPPESFTLEILKNPEIYEGKYYLVWNTLDKQTGIDHFEVQETSGQANEKRLAGLWPAIKERFGFKKTEAPWEAHEQPYIIKDQTLQSIIRVKAVDKAGNSQIAEYFPKEADKKSSSLIGITGLIVLLLLISAYVFFRLKNKKPKRE